MDLDVVNIIAADAATDTMISSGSFFCYAAVTTATASAARQQKHPRGVLMRRAPFVLPVRPVFSGFLPHIGNNHHRPVLLFSRTGTLWSHTSHNPHQSHKPHFHLSQGEMTYAFSHYFLIPYLMNLPRGSAKCCCPPLPSLLPPLLPSPLPHPLFSRIFFSLFSYC